MAPLPLPLATTWWHLVALGGTWFHVEHQKGRSLFGNNSSSPGLLRENAVFTTDFITALMPVSDLKPFRFQALAHKVTLHRATAVLLG